MTVNRNLQRMIHVGCRQLGIDSETRHDLQLVVTGKASMSDMTDADLARMLDALKERGFVTAPGNKMRRKPAARADVRYCHVLWRLLHEAGKVGQAGSAGLNAFIRARFAKAWGAAPINIDAMRDAGQIAAVIRALQAMCDRANIPCRLERRD